MISLCRWVNLSIVATIAVMGPAALALEGPPVSFRAVTQKATVNTSTESVCLADVFEEYWVESRCPRDKEGCCPWRLDASRRTTITRADALRAAIAGHVVLDNSSLKGAAETAVLQTHHALTSDEIRARVEGKLRALAGDGQWSVTAARIHGTANVPWGSTWDVALPTTLMGISSVKIIYDGGSGEALAGWAQVNVAHLRTALVARKDIPAGSALRAEDFKTQQVDVLATTSSSEGSASIATMDAGTPQRTRMALRAGSILTTSAVEKTPAVVTGEPVTLVLKSENLKIMTKGIAQGSGAVGDTVSVQLRSYNRTFRGKVADSKQVEVWL